MADGEHHNPDGQVTFKDYAEKRKDMSATTQEVASSNGSSTAKPARNIEFKPPSRYQTTHTLDLDDYFEGPRDMQKHSKLPFFMRMHGSILPKMILPLLFMCGWGTCITCIHQLVHKVCKSASSLPLRILIVSSC